MANPNLTVLSLRYSSWSMRPWLALTHAGATFTTTTVELPQMQRQAVSDASASLAPNISDLSQRRSQGSITGLFPVLDIGSVQVHESLAICEYVAETWPQSQLWPQQSQERALARAVSTEMSTSFQNIRSEMSCHLFGRVPNFVPSSAAAAEIRRVFEIWQQCLQRSGGPLLFGQFSIADAMYYPMLARLHTYGVQPPSDLAQYARAVAQVPAVQALRQQAKLAPAITVYDDYLINLGGDPVAEL